MASLLSSLSPRLLFSIFAVGVPSLPPFLLLLGVGPRTWAWRSRSRSPQLPCEGDPLVRLSRGPWGWALWGWGLREGGLGGEGSGITVGVGANSPHSRPDPHCSPAGLGNHPAGVRLRDCWLRGFGRITQPSHLGWAPVPGVRMLRLHQPGPDLRWAGPRMLDRLLSSPRPWEASRSPRRKSSWDLSPAHIIPPTPGPGASLK